MTLQTTIKDARLCPYRLSQSFKTSLLSLCPRIAEVDIMDSLQSPQLDIIVGFVLGLPGAGKGTLCARLEKDYPVFHLSIGDHLRNLQKNGLLANCADGVDVDAYLRDRRLLPAEMIVEILAQKLSHESFMGHRNFLIDGFPRTDDSAVLFETKGSSCDFPNTCSG